LNIPVNNVVYQTHLRQAARVQVLKDMKPKKTVPLPSLAKGQLWKTESGHVEIMEVGKTLAHYRLFQSQKRVPTSLGKIQMVQDYLRNNQAKLIKNERLVKAKV
jgi:hypothetical protein